MFSRQECPTCKSHDTEKVMTDFETDVVVEVRVCNNCTVQFTNNYGGPFKEVDNSMSVTATIAGHSESIDALEDEFENTERQSETVVEIELDSVPRLFKFLEEEEIPTDEIEVEA